jgi:hypothetical protein
MMKFYLEKTGTQFPALRRAHIAKEEACPPRRCFCSVELNPEKWLLVEQLPEDVYLCKNCQRLAHLNTSNQQVAREGQDG